MKSLFEQMGGTYRQEGDYLIPNLVPPDTESYSIGKYGRMRYTYLREHRKAFYTSLVVGGTLFQHLGKIDCSCNEQIEILISSMARQENVTEELKDANQMEWVCCINSIRSRAEEIVLAELVYA